MPLQFGPQKSLDAAERRLKEIDSVRGQKLSILKERNPGILQGDQWVGVVHSRVSD